MLWKDTLFLLSAPPRGKTVYTFDYFYIFKSFSHNDLNKAVPRFRFTVGCIMEELIMYDSGQQRAMATELARNGGNIAKAVGALRRDFETMSQISDDTLRRNLEKPEFQTLVKEQEI